MLFINLLDRRLIIWLIDWLIALGSDSPKKAGLPDKVPAPALNGDAQLKYENDRLKLALAQSSANAKVLTRFNWTTIYFLNPQQSFSLNLARFWGS